jgi:diaminohydroxyphosphoribosylaminopyrimidine deaminase / 5-amino-6-(5-phosphoribosylamino)uracil reductase
MLGQRPLRWDARVDRPNVSTPADLAFEERPLVVVEPIESWRAVPNAFRDSTALLPDPWEAIFGPLRRGSVDDLVVVGQIGQSLDGRVATATGHSRYINGPAGLAHLHRLRALVDAVVVGVGSAIADDPQLTVRRVAGPHPARIVIDPRGRLAPTARLLADDGVRRLIVSECGTERRLPGVETLSLPTIDGQISPAAILAALREAGFRRVLIEGGPDTISRFVAARCLDRLHLIVAPILLGSGQLGLCLPSIDRVDEALRPPTRIHPLDRDILVDCDFSARRALIGRAQRPA